MAKVAESTMEAESPKEAPAKTKTAAAKALHLPATPSGTVTNSPENFFAYCNHLTADQWSRTRGYLYRLIPAIRRKPSYIDRFGQPISEDYILRHKLGGSGRYQILLNDRDGAGTFCKCILDLADPEYPPRYNIRELDLASEDNRQLIEELKQEGKLSQNGDVIGPALADNDGTMAQALKDIAIEAMRGRKEQPGMENQAFSKMMEMMASASKQSIEIALGQVKKDDPASFIALLSTAKELFTPAKVEPLPVVNPLDILVKAKELFAAPAKPAEDPMMKLLMEQLAQAQKDSSAERQRNHELQLKMLETKAEAADPMEMVEKVLNIQEKLGGGGEPRNWKEKLVDQGMQYMPDILGAIKGYAQRPAQPVQQQQQRPPQQQPQQQTAQPPAVPPAQPPQGETVTQQPVDPDIAFLLPILESQGRRFVTAFKNDPLSGGEVARSVILYADNATYERIARMGRVKILATIELLPEMKADLLKVGTLDMLNEFIDDFVAGPEDPDEEDGDGDEDDDNPEPGFADPANPEAKQPPRPVISKTAETAMRSIKHDEMSRPKQKGKKVPV